MNLRDFSENNGGINVIARRHAVYNKPVLPVDGNMMCALIYSRTIDPKLLGLNETGRKMMYRQGELLVEMGIFPNLIISGIDQRNVDGATETATAIYKLTGHRATLKAAQHVTYPVYDATRAYEAWQKFGDMAAHMYLAGRPEVEGLWLETAQEFECRIVPSVFVHYPENTPVLLDLNFEQITLLHFLHVENKQRQDIPYDANAWCPKNGGGIAYAKNGAVMEFTPDFEMIPIIVP